MIKALIWDVDGTVAETEHHGHLVAFNLAFADAGLPWRWSTDDYRALLKVTGGRERMLHDMARRGSVPEAERDALALRLHAAKNRHYAELVARGALKARPGVLRLVDECARAGVALAVATTTSRDNVEALFASLWGPRWRDRFAVVVCAEDAPAKKPDPLAYRLALQALGVTPAQAFALEDSPAGLQAARAAGIRCGVTRSVYFSDGPFEGAAWVRDDLDAAPAITLATLATLATQATLSPPGPP